MENEHVVIVPNSVRHGAMRSDTERVIIVGGPDRPNNRDGDNNGNSGGTHQDKQAKDNHNGK